MSEEQIIITGEVARLRAECEALRAVDRPPTAEETEDRLRDSMAEHGITEEHVAREMAKRRTANAGRDADAELGRLVRRMMPQARLGPLDGKTWWVDLDNGYCGCAETPEGALRAALGEEDGE